MRFRDKRTGQVKSACSIEIRGERAYVKFTGGGREYAYYKDNLEVLDSEEKDGEGQPVTIYKLEKQCYRCGKPTSVFTYIVFDDGTDQDVVFPWDKKRLLKNQNILAHIQDPSIEYYGLKVVGENEKLDQALMKRFPGKIKIKYSRTQNRSYPMNLCDHCGAIQGWNYIYRLVNEKIQMMQKMERLD